MVPRIANRGHSFTGAGMYYLHDKEADTSDRVAWTHTHNLPTNDPHKAMKWMAYTDMHASELKEKAGVKTSGRKAEKGSVYSYSLAWHPDETPDEEHMKEKAFDTLDLLGLKNHEAVFVAHQETDHDHVHIIVNLVDPETGKTAKVYKDHLKLSEWAENYEKEHGKIHCEKRVKNNEARKQKENENKIIKHREEKMERAQLIQNLYNNSGSGKSFSKALDKEGYSLAKGDRRGFVIVDLNGNIFSLSRQLKGQRSADIKSKLKDIEKVPNAKELSEERLYFDRDKYESKWQEEVTRPRPDKEVEKSKDNPRKNHKEKFNALYSKSSTTYLAYVDEEYKLKNTAHSKREEYASKLKEYYAEDRLKLHKEKIALKLKIARIRTGSKIKGKEKLIESLANVEKEIKHIDYYCREQINANNSKINKSLSKDLEMLQNKYGLAPNDNIQKPRNEKGGQDLNIKLRTNNLDR